jgi:hypothetical protein
MTRSIDRLLDGALVAAVVVATFYYLPFPLAALISAAAITLHVMAWTHPEEAGR